MVGSTPQEMPWSASRHDVLAAWETDATAGLTEAEAERRLLHYGRNELARPRTRPWVRTVLGQLDDRLVQVLLGAALLTIATGDLHDTVVILLVVLGNTALGAVQEHRAERAVEALDSLTAPQARVVRDGQERRLEAAQVVPGDVLLVEAGDVVPADGRLLEAVRLEVDEAPFTGESVPVVKNHGAVDSAAMLAERASMVHAGTVVSRGRARLVVTSTGGRTEVGQLAELLTRHAAPRTPLQRRLARLSGQLALLVGGVCLVVVAAGLARGLALELILVTGVSLAVAAVPESLPAVVTLSLALAAQRMARRGALVRRLPAVEALGSVTLIASDKTGTLTDGVMTVRRLWTASGTSEVGGHGYGPDGELQDGDIAQREALLVAAVLCNDAVLAEQNGRWSVIGDPTEGALLAVAGKAGLDVAAVRAPWQRVLEEPFDAGRARMTTVLQSGDGELLVVCKGAPEVLLETPGLLAAVDPALHGPLAEMTAQGLRVLAVATRALEALPASAAAAERDLQLVGLIGLQDPPRADAVEAVAQCRAAGIRVVMVTGDHPATALAVAHQLGLPGDGSVCTGRELRDGLVPGPEVNVFARTAPEQKLALVQGWQAAGEIVAMTGDGVNDAPALHVADVGVAMGEGGTDVARQSAGVVLSDDDFATIVHAVKEGRRVYDNIRRFLIFGISGGIAEVLVMLVGPFLGIPLPLLPAQILWMNLLTHGLPGVAMGAEQAEPDTMQRPPRDPEEGVLGGALWQACAALGVVLATVSLLVAHLLTPDDRTFRSVVFVALTLQQLLVALALRSTRRAVLTRVLRGNPLLLGAVGINVLLVLAALYLPGLNTVLDTTPLSARMLLVAAAAACVAPVVVETTKAVVARSARTPVVR